MADRIVPEPRRGPTPTSHHGPAARPYVDAAGGWERCGAVPLERLLIERYQKYLPHRHLLRVVHE